MQKVDGDGEGGAIEGALQEISDALSRADDGAFIRSFFECILTGAERRRISQRWLLVREIQRGATQRATAKKLGLSLCKITRGARLLKNPESPFRKMLELV
jgi:TrpR family trp operon transcriptional repressor